MFNKKSPTKVEKCHKLLRNLMSVFFKPQTLLSLSNKKIILIFLVVLSVLSVFVLAPPPPPPFEGGTGGDNIITYDSTLGIIEINAKVDGKKDTIRNSGEKIGEEAKEESDIEFEIEVKNIFNKEIKNIDITVTINDIDDGDDLEEEADISKLDPGDSKKVDIDFALPLKVDDKEYDVKINIKGKDEDNNLHIIDWVLTLEVKKDKNNVKITKALLSPSALECSRTTNLQLDLLNLGREEEDDVSIEIRDDELGIDIEEKDIELGTGTDDDAEYEKTFSLEIPQDVKEGTYTIQIKVYYNKGRFVKTKDVDLIIEECKQIKQKEAVLVESLPPSVQETIGAAKKEQKETSIIFTYQEPFILLSIMILIILIGLVIFLIGAIIIQLRR